MDRRQRRNIIDAITFLKKTRIERKLGVVADDSPFTVTIAGTDRTDCLKFDGYSPTIGDKVYCTRVGREPWTVHDSVS